MIGAMAETNPSETDEAIEEVLRNELSLLQPAIRSSPDAVLGLLHEDFREFGASGRTWNRAEIAAALAEAPGDGAEAEDMRAVRLARDVVIVTYIARRPDRASLRSSLWVCDAAGWRLFFHQGTLVRDDGGRIG